MLEIYQIPQSVPPRMSKRAKFRAFVHRVVPSRIHRCAYQLRKRFPLSNDFAKDSTSAIAVTPLSSRNPFAGLPINIQLQILEESDLILCQAYPEVFKPVLEHYTKTVCNSLLQEKITYWGLGDVLELHLDKESGWLTCTSNIITKQERDVLSKWREPKNAASMARSKDVGKKWIYQHIRSTLAQGRPLDLIYRLSTPGPLLLLCLQKYDINLLHFQLMIRKANGDGRLVKDAINWLGFAVFRDFLIDIQAHYVDDGQGGLVNALKKGPLDWLLREHEDLAQWRLRIGAR